MNLQHVAVIKYPQIVGCTPSEVYLQITWYYILPKRALSSAVCHITGRRRKGKGLEVPCKYCRPTKDLALIPDPVYIFVILLFSLTTKRDQAFMRDRPQFEAIQYMYLEAIQYMHHFHTSDQRECHCINVILH